MSEKITLFKAQEKIYPKKVDGLFRRLKWGVMIVLLGIYYITPFLRWDRGSHAPNQAVLIDMPHRKAYFFFIEIWPQEIYYLTGILILAAVGLFFVTSLFGRVWCGYACPQTVWTDLFVAVENFVQGDRNARIKLDKGRLSFEKIYKKAVTHILWLIIALLTGGAWVLYFNDAYQLIDQIIHFDVPWSVMSWIIGLTISTYIMAGFAREQVCTYMCPYARFQSAMFDKNTLIIAYNEKRGEPRAHHKTGTSWEGRGHCIDCGNCVTACPMGIDIRNGLQMDCIACGLCIDACDAVMKKQELPLGLIKYDTEAKTPFILNRPRNYWYLIILLTVGMLMLFGLYNRTTLDLNIVHDRNPLFVKLSNGDIRNGYMIHILNKTHQDKTYHLSVEGLDLKQVRVDNSQGVKSDNLPVYADSVGNYRINLFALRQPVERQNIVFVVKDNQTGNVVRTKSIFVSKE